MWASYPRVRKSNRWGSRLTTERPRWEKIRLRRETVARPEFTWFTYQDNVENGAAPQRRRSYGFFAKMTCCKTSLMSNSAIIWWTSHSSPLKNTGRTQYTKMFCPWYMASNAMTGTQTIFCFSVREPDTTLSPLAIHFECVQISVFCYIFVIVDRSKANTWKCPGVSILPPILPKRDET